MENLDMRGMTFTQASAVLTGLSGTAKTISYTSNPAFILDGKFYTGDTCSGGALETTDDTTGAAFLTLANGKCCMFVFTWNADGTWHVSQGKIVNYADVVNGSAALDFPAIPTDACPFAYVPIRNANATSWLFATGNWDAATLTVGTVVNCATLPNQPVTSFA